MLHCAMIVARIFQGYIQLVLSLDGTMDSPNIER